MFEEGRGEAPCKGSLYTQELSAILQVMMNMFRNKAAKAVFFIRVYISPHYRHWSLSCGYDERVENLHDNRRSIFLGRSLGYTGVMVVCALACAISKLVGTV